MSTPPTAPTGKTPAHPTSNSSEMSQDDSTDAKVVWPYVVIGLLTSLLVLLIIFVIYTRREEFFSSFRPKYNSAASVEYRRSLDASFKYEETRSPTALCVDRSSAVTGLEYAEIRVSMVQRCVDKLGAGALTAETGETSEQSLRPNSLYLSYEEKV